MKRRTWWSVAAFLVAAGFAAAQSPAPTAPDANELLRRLRGAPGDAALLDALQRAIPGIADPDVRARALAVRSLGCRLNDRSREAQQARDALVHLAPQSPYLIPLGIEKISRACAFCNGAGKHPEAPCPRCAVAGRCPVCSGKGWQLLMSRRAIRCAACNGTGKCRECKGTGKIPASSCTACGGRGVVLDKEKIRRALVALLAGPAAAPAPPPAK